MYGVLVCACCDSATMECIEIKGRMDMMTESNYTVNKDFVFGTATITDGMFVNDQSKDDQNP